MIRTFLNQPAGAFEYFDINAPNETLDYRARSRDATWPTPDSAYTTAINVGPCG